jgi:hypothetical protein
MQCADTLRGHNGFRDSARTAWLLVESQGIDGGKGLVRLVTPKKRKGPCCCVRSGREGACKVPLFVDQNPFKITISPRFEAQF